MSEEAVIAAVSASIDWFDKNRGGPVPTAEEMSSLLEGFRRAKRVVSPTVANAPPAVPTPSPGRVPEPPVVRAHSPQEEESGGSALTSKAPNSLPSPFPVVRRLRRRPIAPSVEATRPHQPRRASVPAASRASPEAGPELEGRLALDRASREAEAGREAQRARTRVEAEAAEVSTRRAPAVPTPTSSNTFAHPEYSDGDSDEDDRVGKTLNGARHLWIPRGYKWLAAWGQCDAGTEFDLPDWVGVRSPEVAANLAVAWNSRVLGTGYPAKELLGLPTIHQGVPQVAHDWLTQEQMADRFASQREFEKLLHRRDRFPVTPEDFEVLRRKAEQADELVRQRKEAAKRREEKVLARARSNEARLYRAKVDRSTKPSAPSENRPLLESPANRPDPPALLEARAPDRLRARRERLAAAFLASANLSPIPEESPQAAEEDPRGR